MLYRESLRISRTIFTTMLSYRVIIEKDEEGFLSPKFPICLVALRKGKQERNF